MANRTPAYDDIEVLQFPDVVRRRPHMYLGSTDERGLENLAISVISNALNEHLAGHATSVSVRLSDRSLEVEDDGRGVPVAPALPMGCTPLEAVFTMFLAGGRHRLSWFRGATELAVVNAACERLEVEVRREGRAFSMRFERGRVVQSLTDLGPTNLRGTRIRLTPDRALFGAAELRAERLLESLQAVAALRSQLVLRFGEERVGAGLGLVELIEPFMERVQPGSMLDRRTTFVLELEPAWSRYTRCNVTLDLMLGARRPGGDAVPLRAFINLGEHPVGDHRIGVELGISRALSREALPSGLVGGVVHVVLDPLVTDDGSVPALAEAIATDLAPILAAADDRRVAWLEALAACG